MRLLFCTKILITLIQIQPKIIVAVGKLEQKLKKFLPKISHFSQTLHFRENSGYIDCQNFRHMESLSQNFCHMELLPRGTFVTPYFDKANGTLGCCLFYLGHIYLLINSNVTTSSPNLDRR